MSISNNISNIYKNLPDNVKLVAVSKTKPEKMILEAYNCGHKIFGENKVQELTQKQPKLPDDIEWHMIGHLQTNKVKYIAQFIHLIHSVDSFKLLKTINKEGLKNNRTINCLLQIHIAKEEAKFGFSINELKEILIADEFLKLKNVNIIGLMGMATFTEDEELIRSEFNYLSNYFREIKENCFKTKHDFCELSMGMTADYKIAIEEGATMVRIGSAIFGERQCSIK
ncbi:MAG: YggS family pyridoxal phosphate-dependent enzyme [Bacteroidales bacterium]|nr:YggS family pyridoxal phosphate-dependent enzyme [Bacteroidales bacterium]